MSSSDSWDVMMLLAKKLVSSSQSVWWQEIGRITAVILCAQLTSSLPNVYGGKAICKLKVFMCKMACGSKYSNKNKLFLENRMVLRIDLNVNVEICETCGHPLPRTSKTIERETFWVYRSFVVH